MTYIVMPSVVCFSCFFRREKQEKQRKKPLRTVRCKADVSCKAVSKLLNVNATARCKADDVSKAGWSNFKRQGNSPLRSGRCFQGRLAEFQTLRQQSVTKHAVRVPGNAYDVFRKSIFRGCRRIFIYAGRGTCAKPHNIRK